MSVNRFHPLICLSLLLAAGLSASCSRQDRTDELLDKARQSMGLCQFQQAKLYVDSIRILYPDDYVKIKKGVPLMCRIEYMEQERTRAYCDSLLKVRQGEFPEKQKSFVFRQNTPIESLGYYVNVSQLHEQNINRTYLQTKVDEKGRLILTSYYCGNVAVKHTRVRVTAPDGSFCETQEIKADGALNYRFSDGNVHYEIVRFNEQKAGGLLDFVLLHRDEPLQVSLLGEDRTHTYRLQDRDRSAMTGSCELAAVLSDITRLLDEIRLSQAKMSRLAEKCEKLSE